MHLISQLLSKISPPYLTAGDIKRSTNGQWKFDVKQYQDLNHENAYRLDFYIPYDPEVKILRGQKGEQGEAATVKIGQVTTGDEPTVVNSGTVQNAILDIILPKGVKGDQGEPGPQGPMGERGAKGDKGDPGQASMVKVGEVDFSETGLVRVTSRCEQHEEGPNETFLDFHFPKAIMTGGAGYDGKDGKSASIKIGQVVKGDIAYVSNVGTQHDAIFDFILPRGDKGERGEVGPQGQRGPIGQTGKSAYEIAVESGGFRGTEIEWLASLVGEQGPKGDKGDPGQAVEVIQTFPEVFVKSVRTGAPGTEAQAWCDVTKDGRIVRFNFVIPRGFDGVQGQTGDVSLLERMTNIRVGNVYSSQTAKVVNVGSLTEAILDFYLPKGDRGDPGKSAYELAVENGFSGNIISWLNMINNNIDPTGSHGGFSAYEIAVEQGYTGTKKAWLASLKGERGEVGPSAYEIAIKNGQGYATEVEWLNSLKGPKGDPGKDGNVPSFTKGTVTSGSNPDVTVSKLSEGIYKLDFILPDVTSTISSLAAKYINFEDGQTLQDKFDKKSFPVSTSIFSAMTLAASQVIFSDNKSLQSKFNSNELGNGSSSSSSTFTLPEIVFNGNTIKVENAGTSTNPKLKFTFPTAFENYQATSTTTTNTSSGGNTSGNLIPSTANKMSVGSIDSPYLTGYFTHIILSGSQLFHRQIFTSGGKFTVPNDVTTIFVSGCAGGGGGAVGVGGGAGECCIRRSVSVKSGNVLNITVGSGGNGVGYKYDPGGTKPTNRDLDGKDGTNTVVGSLTLKGGNGGHFRLATTNSAGKYDIEPGASGGQYGSSGGALSLCHYLPPTNYRGGYGPVWVWSGGNGGGGIFGSGGPGGFINPTDFDQTTSGGNGGGFGAGGGGGAFAIHSESDSFLSRPAGNGSPGIVILEWC